MKKYHWLPASIDALPGSRTIRLVLKPEAVRASGMPFAKILHPNETRAFVWEACRSEGGLYAWVERPVLLADTTARGLGVFDVRREEQAQARVVTMREERGPEERELSASVKETYALHSLVHTLHKPDRLEPTCIFDPQLLLDLPPPEWPRTRSIVDCRKFNLRESKPTAAQTWAGHLWARRKFDQAEERHAARVLDNERLAEHLAYRKRVREAQALVASLQQPGA